MPHYELKSKTVEAFRFGIDSFPEWAEEAKKEGLLNEYELLCFPGRKCCDIEISADKVYGRMTANMGDYIVLKDGMITCHRPDFFEAYFELKPD